MKNKKTLGILLLILLILICFITIIVINKNNNPIDTDNENQRDGLVGGIENEDYYYQKQNEYIDLEDERENLTQKYINTMFSNEEKSELAEYQNKMTNAVKNGDRELKKQISKEYVQKIEDIIENKCTEEQKNKLNELNKKIEDLEPIITEYDRLKMVEIEKRRNEGIITLPNGDKSNTRENIIKDKEVNGWKFSNISLIYNSRENCTIFKARVSNATEETKENETLMLKFTGDVGINLPINIEQQLKGEYQEIEVPIYSNIIYANNLEILK